MPLGSQDIYPFIYHSWPGRHAFANYHEYLFALPRGLNVGWEEVKLVKLEFLKEKGEIYQMVEARSQAKFNRYLRVGTVLKCMCVSFAYIVL